MRKIFIIILFLITYSLYSQEDENKNKEDIISIEDTNEIWRNENDYKQLIGLIFSFSGFNEFRYGMGIVFGTLGRVGSHPVGYDYGLLFEYNFKENIIYNRFYFHFTGGSSAMLLGASVVVAHDNEDMSIGFAPEIGIGLSTVGGIFYRYNFYLNNKFNSYEVVFHINICKRN